MSKVCANSTTTGCVGTVTQRGNILCDACIELRKSSAKTRRDGELDQLTERNRILEEKVKLYEGEIAHLKTELNEAANKVKTLEEETKKLGYSEHLENESNRLSELLTKIMSENEGLVREKGTFEIAQEQAKLDLERLGVENSKMSELVAQLSEENLKLQEENKNLYETLEQQKLSSAVPRMGRVTSMPIIEIKEEVKEGAKEPVKEVVKEGAKEPVSKVLRKTVSAGPVKKPTIPATSSAVSAKSKLASRFPKKDSRFPK